MQTKKIVAKELTPEQRSKIQQEFGKKEETLRKSRDMSQQDVADQLDIPRSGVSVMEDGERDVGIAELLKIMKMFNKSPQELLTSLLKYISMSETQAVADMSENQTPYAPISAVLKSAEALGLGMGSCNVETKNLLNKALGSKKFQLNQATVTFSANLQDEDSRRTCMDWVDDLGEQFPASRFSLEFDSQGMSGEHALSFLTTEE